LTGGTASQSTAVSVSGSSCRSASPAGVSSDSGFGALTEAPKEITGSYAVQIAGDWRSAAERWERIGCPYEQATALADGDEAARRSALEIFERLGAEPAAEALRQRLRAASVRGIPRGPRPSTRENPLGLTIRQMEVLALLARGRRNVEIAERLFISAKTVDHHISAILAKFDARSRAEAVAEAQQRGILRPAK
jgi:DNA-binding CsgD family transcriptional regulator